MDRPVESAQQEAALARELEAVRDVFGSCHRMTQRDLVCFRVYVFLEHGLLRQTAGTIDVGLRKGSEVSLLKSCLDLCTASIFIKVE